MNRVVVHVFPESPPPAPPSEHAGGASPELYGSEAHQALTVESLLSDAQVRSFLATLMDEAPGVGWRALIANMLQQQRKLAGPDAGDLFHRIVPIVEKLLIAQIFQECHHVKSRTAARLGIDRNTLHKKLRLYEFRDETPDPEPAHPSEQS
ncbi:MAG: helix-turn-helix domain-containing protein [Planctomycetaceae bacterium]